MGLVEREVARTADLGGGGRAEIALVTAGAGAVRTIGISNQVGAALGLGRGASAAEIGAFAGAQPAVFGAVNAGVTEDAVCPAGMVTVEGEIVALVVSATTRSTVTPPAGAALEIRTLNACVSP